MAAALQAPVLGGKAKVELDAEVFGVPMNAPLLHEAVKAELAARRQGTHATKTRGLVAGGRAKPWRQKGTGRARQGTTRAPQWAGGGVVFGPSPRDYTLKVNKKAARRALRIALSQHAAEGSLAVFDAAAFAKPRTKDAVALVADWREGLPLLVVVLDEEDAAGLSFRNLDRCAIATVADVGVADLLWARRLAVSQAALERLVGTRGGGGA
jgi:large subunit ribosomal protein L4